MAAIKSRKLLNDTSDAAKDALTGLVLCNKGLVLLENQPILMRRDHNEMQGKVKIISGGGAGHEPSFAGFVGPGMLTAAVVGNIFTAPPSCVILQAIRELGKDHSEGVLLIVLNYTGCRINFTVAMERAQNEGIYVKLLIVQDDCSLKLISKPQERRGLAGIVLIIKIAGAMAEEGKRLDEIFDTCNALAISDVATISVGFSSQGLNRKSVMSNDVLLGIGLYGEHWVQKFPFECTKEIVQRMMVCIMEFGSESELLLAPSTPFVVLINNMGNASKLEECIFVMEAMKQIAEINITIARSYCGSFLTSLEVAGFSISLLKVRKPDILKYLDAPTQVMGWPQHFQCKFIIGPDDFSLPDENLPYSVPSKFDVEEEDSRDKLCIGPKMSPKSAQSTLQILGLVADAISACERQLNLFDCEVGDGETGTVLKRAAMAIKNAIKTDKIISDHPYAILQVLSGLCENSMGGIHGGFYSIFLAAAAKAFQDKREDYPIDAFLWLEALREGNKALINYSCILPGDKSLVISLDAAANALENSLNESPDEQVDALQKAATAAETEAQKTVGKRRRLCGVEAAEPLVMPDPSAHAVGIWLRALYEGCRLLMF